MSDRRDRDNGDAPDAGVPVPATVAAARLPAAYRAPGTSAATRFRRRAETGRLVWVAIALIAVTFVGFGTWAATAPLSSAALAPGVVSVASDRRVVDHLEGGILRRILVRNGDRVREGETLIVLDDTRAKAAAEALRLQYLAARAQESRLLAERDDLDRLRLHPDLLAAGDDQRVAEMVAQERSVFRSRAEVRDGQKTILGQKAAKLREQIRGIEGLDRQRRRQMALIEDELVGLRDLQRKGYVSRTRVLALERAAAELTGQSARDGADAAAVEQSIREVELEMLQLRKAFLDEVNTQLRAVQAQLSDLGQRLDAAEDVLARTVLRAPASGIVIGLAITTPGAVTPPGGRLLEIVPEDEPLIVEARVRPEDIEDIRAGLDADVMLTAFRQRVTPTVSGRVTYVSADRVHATASDPAHYVAQVAFAPGVIESLQGVLLPGMPAEVLIKTGQLTPLDYLLGPILDSFRRSLIEH